MDTVTTHTVEDIVETIAFFDDWEDRYRYIIDLGKELPAMPDSRKREELLVRGCQSQGGWTGPSVTGASASMSTAMR